MCDKPLTTKEFISSLDYLDINPNDLRHLLESKHANLVDIFRAIIQNKKYQSVGLQLIHNMLSNVYKMVSEKLELYIIENIWKEPILSLLLIEKNDPYIKFSIQHNPIIKANHMTKSSIKSNNIYMKVFVFLCQKMRSLKYEVRLTALKSFEQLILAVSYQQKSYSQGNKSSSIPVNLVLQKLSQQKKQRFDQIFVDSLPVMLRKQQLVKQVSYNQGLFLQLLEDEYHQVRVTTLALLQLVALRTSYFYEQNHKSEKTSCGTQYNYENLGRSESTLNSLKQTILYMLNDEHELVRERSLVCIYRITERNLSLNVKQSNKQIKSQTPMVFCPLNHEQLSTVLMCLKQNNTVLRQKVYQCLKLLQLSSINQLILIVQKLYQTLLVYKLDKTKIYMLLKQFSIKHKSMMLEFIDLNPKENFMVFYNYDYFQEPNCKNFIYKGRLILLRQVIKKIVGDQKRFNIKNKYQNILPSFIIRHLSYVEDTEAKLKLCESRQYYNQSNHNNKSQNNQQTRQFLNEQRVKKIALTQIQTKIRKLSSIAIYKLRQKNYKTQNQKTQVFRYKNDRKKPNKQKKQQQDFETQFDTTFVLIIYQFLLVLDAYLISKRNSSSNLDDKMSLRLQKLQDRDMDRNNLDEFQIEGLGCQQQQQYQPKQPQHLRQEQNVHFQQQKDKVQMSPVNTAISVSEYEIRELLMINNNNIKNNKYSLKYNFNDHQKGLIGAGHQQKHQETSGGNIDSQNDLNVQARQILFRIRLIQYLYNIDADSDNRSFRCKGQRQNSIKERRQNSSKQNQQNCHKDQSQNVTNVQGNGNVHSTNSYQSQPLLQLVKCILCRLKGVLVDMIGGNQIIQLTHNQHSNNHNDSINQNINYNQNLLLETQNGTHFNSIPFILSSVEQYFAISNNYNHCHYNDNNNYTDTVKLLRRKQFKIRPIATGRSTNNYQEKLLIIVEHPEKINSHQQLYQVVNNNDNLWLKCEAVTYSSLNGKGQRILFYIKYSQLFRYSQMRPVIDYNQNKTIYMVELPLKLNHSKLNNLILYNHINSSGRQQSMGKLIQQLNREKLSSYLQKQLLLASVTVVFTQQQYQQLPQHQYQPQYRQQHQYHNNNKTHHFHPLHYKQLATWTNPSIPPLAIQNK